MAGEENKIFDNFDFSIFDTEEVQEETVDETTSEETTEEASQEELDEEITEDTTTSSSEEETTSEESEEKETEDNSSPLLPYAKLLVEEGILPNFNLEEFDGSSTGLMEAMGQEINKGVDYYKSTLPEEISKLITNYEEGVPLATLLDIDSNRKQYNSIKEDQVKNNKDLQKSLIKEHYRQTTKFSDEKIEKLIQRFDDLEELEEESKNSLKELVDLQDYYEEQAREQAKIRNQELEQERIKTLETFKSTLENYTEIVPGIKLNKNVKDTILKSMTTPVGQDEYGNPLNEVSKYRVENPYKFDITLSYLFTITKGFKDWSVISSAGKKSAIQEFEKSVDKQKERSVGKEGRKKVDGNLLDAIANFNLKK